MGALPQGAPLARLDAPPSPHIQEPQTPARFCVLCFSSSRRRSCGGCGRTSTTTGAPGRTWSTRPCSSRLSTASSSRWATAGSGSVHPSGQSPRGASRPANAPLRASLHPLGQVNIIAGFGGMTPRGEREACTPAYCCPRDGKTWLPEYPPPCVKVRSYHTQHTPHPCPSPIPPITYTPHPRLLPCVKVRPRAAFHEPTLASHHHTHLTIRHPSPFSPCSQAPRGYQSDHYLFSLALGHTYMISLPLVTTASSGNSSTLHQDHVALHVGAFHRVRWPTSVCHPLSGRINVFMRLICLPAAGRLTSASLTSAAAVSACRVTSTSSAASHSCERALDHQPQPHHHIATTTGGRRMR